METAILRIILSMLEFFYLKDTIDSIVPFKPQCLKRFIIQQSY